MVARECFKFFFFQSSKKICLRNIDGIPKPTDNFVELTSTFAVATGSISNLF